MTALVRPAAHYRSSFLEAVREAQTLDSGLESTKLLEVAKLEADFEGYVNERTRLEHREYVQPGFVPQSDFWLVEGDEYIGLLKLRHELNESLFLIGGHIGYEIRPTKRGQGHATRMLALGLLEARRIGLTGVLLTCDDDNVASYRVMEANGAVLRDVLNIEGREKLVRRYWIDLAN
jgi:predicted acetyltransferase